MKLPIDYRTATWQERKKAREQYVKLQENKCYYCGGVLSETPPEKIKSKKINWKLFPPNFLKYPIHLHHSHDTGKTIGAVHALCNAVLWQYEGE
jgi:hypothetical protein